MAFNSEKRQSLKPHLAQSKADVAVINEALPTVVVDMTANPSITEIESYSKVSKSKRGRPSSKSKKKIIEEPAEKVMMTMRLDKGLYIALVDVAKSLSENKVISVQSVMQQLAEDCVRKSQRNL